MPLITLVRKCARLPQLLFAMTVLQPIRLVRQCTRFRELLFAMTARELRAHYRGTLFGPLWIVIQPLFFLVVYFAVFGQLFQNRSMASLPGISGDHPLTGYYKDHAKAVFALSMFVGLIPWMAFSEAVSRATGSIIQSGGLIKKFAFPSELLPVTLVKVSLVNTTISLAVLALAKAIILGSPPEMLWLLPIMLVLQAVLTLGVAYIVAASAVFIRDLVQLVPILLTFVFFLSPIFYVTRQFESEYSWVLEWNPMTYLISPYRQIFVMHPGLLPFTHVGEPPWRAIGILAAVAFSVLVLGLSLFHRLKPRFADEI